MRRWRRWATCSAQERNTAYGLGFPSHDGSRFADGSRCSLQTLLGRQDGDRGLAGRDVEQRIGEGQVVHIGWQVAIDDKAHRHLDTLTRLQHLVGKAKTFSLVKVRR